MVLSSSLWAKRRVITPKETNRDMTMDCQKQKKTMNFTAMNFSNGFASLQGLTRQRRVIKSVVHQHDQVVNAMDTDALFTQSMIQRLKRRHGAPVRVVPVAAEIQE